MLGALARCPTPSRARPDACAASRPDPRWSPAWTRPVLWMRATHGVTLTAAAVSAWLDLSASANSGSQGTAGNRPTLTASWQRGQPALAFAGGQWLALTAAAGQATPFTFAAVMQWTSTAASRISAGTTAGVGGVAFNVGAVAGKRVVWKRGVSFDDDGNATTDAEQWVVTRDTAVSAASTFYVNGAVQVTSTPNAVVNAPSGVGIIGAGSGAGVVSMVGYVAEVVVCNDALSAATLAQWNAYNSARYGVG